MLCSLPFLFCFSIYIQLVVTRPDWSVSILHLDHLQLPLETFNIPNTYLTSSWLRWKLFVYADDRKILFSLFNVNISTTVWSMKLSQTSANNKNTDKAIILSHQKYYKPYFCSQMIFCVLWETVWCNGEKKNIVFLIFYY